jgi:hypothetical protein
MYDVKLGSLIGNICRCMRLVRFTHWKYIITWAKYDHNNVG